MDNLWDRFESSGKIEDYLTYRSERNREKEAQAGLAGMEGDGHAVCDQGAGAQDERDRRG